MKTNTDDIKVSVCIITYNQEKYIETCLKSLINQDCNFKYEIIIGDDSSTDETRIIIDKVSDEYPDRIKKIYHKENIGTVGNILSVYKLARGKYIAHIDGDDYAFPNKLSKQVQALENNPDCVICSHDMYIVNQHGKKIKSNFISYEEGEHDIRDLYENLPFFCHSSKMFINDLSNEFWINMHPNTLDIEVHIAQANKGSIYHLDTQLGAYRYLTGVSSKNKRVNPILIEGNQRIFNEALLDNKIDKEFIKYCYAKSIFNYAYQSAVFGNKDDFNKYIKTSCEIVKYSIIQKIFYFLRYIPFIAIVICQLRAKLRGYKIL
ncbi:glycosyltransferase family 2 protein [Xenorhabdus sp. Reich]|uniref:Glycosyltransferase family 2 protein n=1 Tax=Xenorhabdus littoralis TaxID=2582835 RepID=A0ABU4SJM8_9GAMM|nr:glycosyltransferase family 2 protein [Xenorhabdus sp. Reich]MDX7998857.1 glycosyltransferase family 2 protein [Xenorhabdus sp. Reich]